MTTRCALVPAQTVPSPTLEAQTHGLKAACEGRLAPQDPADKPAEVLLERIRAGGGRFWTTNPTKRTKDTKEGFRGLGPFSRRDTDVRTCRDPGAPTIAACAAPLQAGA